MKKYFLQERKNVETKIFQRTAKLLNFDEKMYFPSGFLRKKKDLQVSMEGKKDLF